MLLGFPLPGGSRHGGVVRIVPVDEDHPYTLPIGGWTAPNAGAPVRSPRCWRACSHVGTHLLTELRAAGADVAVIEQLLPYVQPGTELWPDGARDLPMRWANLAVPSGALLSAALALVWRRQWARRDESRSAPPSRG